MFDRIAPRYDLLNRVLSAGVDVRWRRSAVGLLRLAGPARLLDLCTGTADLLIECLGRDGRRRGVGIDVSGEMLVRGARKLEARGVAGRAGLVSGDVQRLPFDDATFDGALVAFGIRNVSDPLAAAVETRRVLRPGAPLVVLEFSMPAGLPGALYRSYFLHVLPWIGGIVSGDRHAYAYLPASVGRFPRPQEFAALLEQAGFVSVEWRALTAGIAHLYRAERPV
jgi:demethylmenaquinone methyltransferase/2-methoxy-6-polyprenyl-1,4-benzoquinol methylase